MYQNSVLGNFLWRSGAESFAWRTYNILVQGGGGLPPPVGGSVGGRGRQRPPPKETPCSCTSRACSMYVHCTYIEHTHRGPWPMASSSCTRKTIGRYSACSTNSMCSAHRICRICRVQLELAICHGPRWVCTMYVHCTCSAGA